MSSNPSVRIRSTDAETDSDGDVCAASWDADLLSGVALFSPLALASGSYAVETVVPDDMTGGVGLRIYNDEAEFLSFTVYD